MATVSSSVSSFNDTPVRLPKMSDLNEENLREINLSQEEDDSNVIFEGAKDNESHSQQREELKRKEMKENIKRRKRLMRYDSSEEPIKLKKKAKDKKKLDALQNPKKRI